MVGTQGPTLAVNSSRALGGGAFYGGSVPSGLTGLGNHAAMAELPPLSHAGSLWRQSKQQIADLFLQNLRQRGNLDVDAPGFAEDLRAHFESLPSR